MTDKTDETGKGPYGPGDTPKRPHATIDIRATEIGRNRGQAPTPGGTTPEGKGGALPPPKPAKPDVLARAWATITGALATMRSLRPNLARGRMFLSHAAAGVAGAALTLVVIGLLGLLGLLATNQGGERAPPNFAKRLVAVEKALQQQPALLEGATAKLASAETRLTKLEEQVQAAKAQRDADAKAVEARIPSPDTPERIGKLEAALAALAADDKSATARFGDVEKLAGEASEAKAAAARLQPEVARLNSEAQSLRQGLEVLKGSVEERLKGAAKPGDLASVNAKLAVFEGQLNALLKTEGERDTGTRQVLLALELASLKRAVDRGDSYTRELDAVRHTAAGSVDLAPLERHSRTGVPTLGVLKQTFRRTTNAAVDAEHEQPDASVVGRLMAGARSVVRWRRASYDADDTSVEAILARMESALDDGHLGEALAQGKRLPPKAARAAEDWLRKLEARTAADRAIANIEAALKASLAGRGPPAAEGTR